MRNVTDVDVPSGMDGAPNDFEIKIGPAARAGRANSLKETRPASTEHATKVLNLLRRPRTVTLPPPPKTASLRRGNFTEL
jgi:hypothetical protein